MNETIIFQLATFLMLIIPVVIFIFIIVFIIRIIRRMQRRADERLNLDKEIAIAQQQQMKEINEIHQRLNSIEKILKEVD